MLGCNPAGDLIAGIALPASFARPGFGYLWLTLIIALDVAVLCVFGWLVLHWWRAEHRRRHRLAEVAREAEQLREESRRKSFFLNAVSHDLRTPLNGLLLQASLAEVGAAGGDGEAVRRAVREIKLGAKAAAGLLDGLLEYARVDAAVDNVVPEPVDLGPFVGDVIAAASAEAARKGLAIRACVPQALVVHTDRRRLERVLANLVTNAVKFADEGEIRVEVRRKRDKVCIHVIDTGIGIAPEHRDRLFKEFFQVNNQERNRRKGFGLGLAIARKMARQAGGDVTVESALGHGSRFTVSLPHHPAAKATAPASPIQAPPPGAAAAPVIAPPQTPVPRPTVA